MPVKNTNRKESKKMGNNKLTKKLWMIFNKYLNKYLYDSSFKVLLCLLNNKKRYENHWNN